MVVFTGVIGAVLGGNGLPPSAMRQNGVRSERVVRATPSWVSASLANGIVCQGLPFAAHRASPRHPAVIIVATPTMSAGTCRIASTASA